MKVILLKDVAKVGQRGTIKDVADGYAQNMLIARGLAEQATPEKIVAHEAARKRHEAEEAKEAQALAVTIQTLEGKRIEITARATEKGGLFKSLGAKDIVRALGEKGSMVPVETVQLEKPLKEVGEHKILIASGNVRAHVNVFVKAT